MLLAGCEGAPPATPETQPPPVQVTIYPSATPSAAPTPEFTATPPAPTATPEPTPLPTPTPLPPHPLQIDVMRQRDYPGSDIEIEETLAGELEEAGQIHEYYVYPGDNHNLSNNLSLALQRSVAFFDQYVKGG
jgi:hypothetical protein